MREKVNKSSLRRSKPSYVLSIVGVALVLLIMGIMGWIFLNMAQAGNMLKEDIRFSAYLRTRSKDTIAAIQQYITSQPYARNVEYVNKDKAMEIWNKENVVTVFKAVQFLKLNFLLRSKQFLALLNFFSKNLV